MPANSVDVCILSHFFCKNFVKVMFLLKKLLELIWRIFFHWDERKFLFLRHGCSSHHFVSKILWSQRFSKKFTTHVWVDYIDSIPILTKKDSCFSTLWQRGNSGNIWKYKMKHTNSLSFHSLENLSLKIHLSKVWTVVF